MPKKPSTTVSVINEYTVEWVYLSDRLKYRVWRTADQAIGPGPWRYMSFTQAGSLKTAAERGPTKYMGVTNKNIRYFGLVDTKIGNLFAEGLVDCSEETIHRAYGPDYVHVIATLTPKGETVGLAIGDRPEPRKREDDRSKYNVKLSKAQQQLLNNWPKNRSFAIPVGSKEPEAGRWMYLSKISPTHKCLLQMGLIEVGIAGVLCVEGEQQIAKDGRGRNMEPRLVARITALGVVYADSL